MKKVNSLYLIVTIATITMMALAFNVSSSGDEPTQAKIGDNILKFYETWGRDSTALKPVGIDQWQYYGSSFDTFCQFVVQIFGLDDQYTFRHLMNALTGGLILLFIGLFGRLLKNDAVGIIGVVLAFFSPKLLGHSFNNPKEASGSRYRNARSSSSARILPIPRRCAMGA